MQIETAKKILLLFKKKMLCKCNCQNLDINLTLEQTFRSYHYFLCFIYNELFKRKFLLQIEIVMFAFNLIFLLT